MAEKALRPYEVVVLLHPDLEIDLDKPLKKIEGIIKDQGGNITKQDNWGKRKLAYTIAKEDYAIYVYYEVELPPAQIAKVESTLNITDEVLRYLITQPVPEAPEEEKESADKEANDEKGSKEDKEGED